MVQVEQNSPKNAAPRTGMLEAGACEPVPGENLRKHAPAMFAYDFDLLVPKRPGEDGPRVAVGFDRGRLTTCCATVRDFVASEQSHAPATSMVLRTPSAHQASVRGMLSFLVPPGRPSEPLSLMELKDIMDVADFLCLDARSSTRVTDLYARKVSSASIPELAELLGCRSPAARDTALTRILQQLEFSSAVEALKPCIHHVRLEALRQILAEESLKEDDVWALLSQWWSSNHNNAWPTLATLADNGIDVVRWHALSDEVFNACADHGCFAWHEYDDWTNVRHILRHVSCRTRQTVEASAGGRVIAARRRETVYLPASICINPATGMPDFGRVDSDGECAGPHFVDGADNHVTVKPR